MQEGRDIHQSGQKASQVLKQLDHILTSPCKNYKTDGIHRIVDESTNLVMVTDLLELRLKASEKKRRKSEMESERKRISIQELLAQLEQNQNILQETVQRCKRLQTQCGYLNAEMLRYKNKVAQTEIQSEEIHNLRKQNANLKKELSQNKQEANIIRKKYQQQILHLKMKRKLEKNEWKILYEELVKEINKLNRQIRINSEIIHYQENNPEMTIRN